MNIKQAGEVVFDILEKSARKKAETKEDKKKSK